MHKIGDEVYFLSGGLFFKGKIFNTRVIPSGCLWIRVSETEYQIQVLGQEWSVWIREGEIYRNIQDYYNR